MRRLDDFDFDDVDLIKIDVEGHEAKVIEGAEKTIRRTTPVLIVEIEQRHLNRPMEEVLDQIVELGYAGFFMKNGQLVSTNDFSFGVHQEPYLHQLDDPNYVNNFFFVPLKKE